MLPEAVSLYCRSVNATVPCLRSMGVIKRKCHRWRCRHVHRTDGFCWVVNQSQLPHGSHWVPIKYFKDFSYIYLPIAWMTEPATNSSRCVMLRP